MEKALQQIKQLAVDFSANEKAYLAQTYSESQVRQDFIDKFFTALGWDVTHAVQKNPYEQEVKIENRVTMADSQRRADYAFSIAPNFDQVKFFVEAKKPSRTLANPDDYFQTIRYAWNTRIPIAVLTDFEEFHILDCRHKPNIKNILQRKIAEYRYTEYAEPETFAKIFHLFGREAIAAGSLEKFASTLPKKGTKTVGGVQLVDDAFLEELDSYREILAKAFKKTNESLQGDELTEAVQRTIDRLVFIRFLEDKGIEDKQIVALSDPKTAWKSFSNLCKRFEPKYNGLVFKQHRILDSGEFQAPDGNAVAGIFQKISDPASPYDFNQIPVSILGSIYERFLGKVVHATEKRVKVEEKPEVRKAGGVYYTPEYIVKYIVKETVGKLLYNETSQNNTNESNPGESKDAVNGKTPAEIANMAFADIACGSGSFLIEVYQQLLDYHLKYYIEHPEAVGKDVLFERNGKQYLTLKKKKEILVNNVYGVDIDFQATEVTQLSLYLKMLENATMSEAHQFGMFKETILPDLRQNIICGNSLIGRDILDGELFSTIDESKLKPMDFEDAFPKIMKRGGFDAVVGNPPYVRQEGLSLEFKKYVSKKYSVSTSSADLYVYFFEKGHHILKKDIGLFGVICSNKFMRAAYGENLRKFITNYTSIEKIIDFGELPVFLNAATFPAIILTKNRSSIEQSFSHSQINRLNFNSLSDEVKQVEKQLDQNSLLGNNWNLTSNEDIALIKQMEQTGVPLKEYSQSDIYFGIKTGMNEAFVVDKVTMDKIIVEDIGSKKFFHKFIVGDNVRKYQINFENKYLLLIPKGWTKSNLPKGLKAWEWFKLTLPSIAKHLAQFEKKAISRTDQGDFWWELRACDYYDKIDGYKIIYPDIAKESRATLDTSGYYIANTIYFIPTDDKYLLALLNSKLIFHYFKRTGAILGDADKGGRLRWFRQDVLRIPIRKLELTDPLEKSRYEHIVNLVTQMIDSKQKLLNSKTEAESSRIELLIESIDRQIDKIIYDLYNLSDEQIQIVEGIR